MSTALLYSEPDAVKAEYVSDTWIRLLEERHGEEVRWINDTFFGGREVLKIYNGPLDMPRVESPKGLSARTWEALTRWAFERLAAAETESVAQIQEYFGRYIDATPDSAYAEKIPADFNPIEYLSLWPDLVAARVNPFDHYVRHGIAEGRAYRVTG